LVNSLVKSYLTARLPRLERALRQPEATQQRVFQGLIRTAAQTQFGQTYKFNSIRHYKEYSQRIPCQTYEEFKPWISKALAGEGQVLWPSTLRWFAKSSGTTDDKSKFIPVTRESLQDCHYRASRDVLSFYTKCHPNHQLFNGKSLVLTGSTVPANGTKIRAGDVSGVLIENLAWWIHWFRTPPKSIALIPDWETKIERMLEVVGRENVTCIGGVPSWMLVLIRRLMEKYNIRDLHQIWPNLELFIHGAVNFEPYREPFSAFFPNKPILYYETYNASEGFFAIQDSDTPGEMTLMTDYGIFYEFIPFDNTGQESEPIPLWEVEKDRQYAVVISTNAGLWRYKLGDTIVFTDTKPYRIRITGRTKHFINAFGEELMVDNAEQALAHACKGSGAVLSEYTVAPVYLNNSDAGCHEWIIEFRKQPHSLELFGHLLDEKLMELNSDYESKRRGNLTLKTPIIQVVPENTFYIWMKKRGKLGGQHKVPRLYNDRRYVEEIKRDLA